MIKTKQNKANENRDVNISNIGKNGVIGSDDVEKALEILKKYKEGKSVLEQRIVENEQWFRLRHWDTLNGRKGNENASAWLFNSIANKHADAMDNFPQVTCLPREESDRSSAEILSQISFLSVLYGHRNS